MPKVDIEKEKCKGCGFCVLYCPKACIVQEGIINKKGATPAVFLDKNKGCTGCSFCAIICPDLCITVYK
ncbi:MAG: 4Fe-4S binding protein [Candidatus Omnitrophica bacterium]|nr:4Fe-4S binding protein [Candidatus Omnitrophota bacterium]